MPVLESLRNLLKNDEIRNNIENPLPHESGVYRTVLDGSYYRENFIPEMGENALAIIFYYDDLGISNPLGTASKDQKMSMFYWSLGNIHPNLRSSQNSIQLYAIVKYEYLQKPKAFEKLMKKLKTEGVNVEVTGELKNYKGSVLFCPADTPAAAMLGGFKQSVNAHRFCRSCTVLITNWQNYFCDTDFIARDRVHHDRDLEAVTDGNVINAARKFWQRRLGVNSRSMLTEIIDVTQCLPRDCMHILIEGSL